MELTVLPVAEALLAMRPQTREILLVHGTAVVDRSWRDTALRQLAPMTPRVKITAFPELALNGLKPRLAALSQEQAVLYLSYFQGPGGETYTPARVVGEIAPSASVPVLAPYHTQIGTGVLGVVFPPSRRRGWPWAK